MNAQTRREMAEKCAREIAYSAMLFDMGHTARANIVEHYLREWGLEMAKIAEQLDDYNNVGIARRITAANDQQKSVNKEG